MERLSRPRRPPLARRLRDGSGARDEPLPRLALHDLRLALGGLVARGRCLPAAHASTEPAEDREQQHDPPAEQSVQHDPTKPREHRLTMTSLTLPGAALGAVGWHNRLANGDAGPDGEMPPVP